MRTPTEQEATAAVDAAARAVHDSYRAASEQRGVPAPMEYDDLPPLAKNQYREQVLPVVWAALSALPDRHPGLRYTGWMLVERDAFEEVRGDPDGQVVGYDPIDGYGWPDARWISEARRVVQTVDDESCALTYITDEATGQMCSNSIGWVLCSHEDGYGRETENVEFRSFVLVEVPPAPGVEYGKVVAVCEECGPDDMYGAAYLGVQARIDQIEDQRRKAREEREHRSAIADELRDKGVE